MFVDNENSNKGMEMLLQATLMIGSLVAKILGMHMLSAILFFIIMMRYCYMVMYSLLGGIYFIYLSHKEDNSPKDREDYAGIGRLFIKMTIVSAIGVIALLVFKTYVLM